MDSTFVPGDDRQNAQGELTEKTLSRSLSRRSLLHRAALLGLSAPVVSGLLAACGGEADDEEPAATTGEEATPAGGNVEETPAAGVAETEVAEATEAVADEATETIAVAPVGEGQPGGTMVFGLLRDPIAFDPHINYGASSSSLQGNVYDTLIEYDLEGNLIGALAEEWEASDDGLEYVFSLRQGVTFHNGNPFTAEDVIFNFDRVLDEATGATRRGELSNLESYEAVDEYTVRVSLQQPYATLLAVLATPEMYMVDKEWIESGVDPTKEMNGTGPFMLDSFEPEVKYTLVRFPDYWKPELPYLERIEQIPINDDNARMNALRSGEINFVEYVPWQNMEELDADPSFTLYQGFDLFNLVRLNPNRPPLDNKLVRQALNYAVDREAIIAVAFGGLGRPMTAGLIPEESPWFNKELEGYWSYDPEKALALLAEAGVDPSSVQMDLTAATISVHMDTAQVVAQQLEQLGMSINIIQQDVPTLTERRTTGDYQMMQDGLSLAYPDPDAYSVYFETGGAAYARGVNYSNSVLDELLLKGRSTLEDHERKQIYLEFEKALFEDAPWIFLLWRPQAEASIASMNGYVRIPGLGLRSEAFMENVWIDE